jgi:hypothetical protein
MEIFRIRKNAYIEGSKVGFVAGIIVTIATARFIQKFRQDLDSRHPFSQPK